MKFSETSIDFLGNLNNGLRGELSTLNGLCLCLVRSFEAGEPFALFQFTFEEDALIRLPPKSSDFPNLFRSSLIHFASDGRFKLASVDLRATPEVWMSLGLRL